MPRDGAADDRIRVEHMRLAALDVVELSRGRTAGELASDMPLRRALVNAIQDIGEAASKVTAFGRTRVPTLPWDAIVATRHRLAHGYSEIDSDGGATPLTTLRRTLGTRRDPTSGGTQT